VAYSRLNFAFYYHDPLRKMFELETRDWRRSITRIFMIGTPNQTLFA